MGTNFDKQNNVAGKIGETLVAATGRPLGLSLLRRNISSSLFPDGKIRHGKLDEKKTARIFFSPKTGFSKLYNMSIILYKPIFYYYLLVAFFSSAIIN